MDTTVTRLPPWLRTHWFVLVAAVVMVADFAIVSTDDWTSPRLIEAGLLIDFAIIVPLLYLWCYRAQGKRAVVRALALGCFGIWAAGWTIPPEHHYALDTLRWFRYVGLAVLVVIEIKLVAMLWRAVFSAERSAIDAMTQRAGESGMPPWVVRIMAWEAGVWRRAWLAARRWFTRAP